MRAVGAVLVLLLAVLPAGARSDISPTRRNGETGGADRQRRRDRARRRDPAGSRGRAQTCADPAGTGARHRNAAGRPPGPPVRSRLVRRLQRPGQWRDQRQDHGRHQDVPARSQVQGNRRPQHRRNAPSWQLRRRPSRRRSAGAWSTIPSPVRASGFRPSRSPTRARPRTGLAGLRRKARSRSRPSRSGSPARRSRRSTSNRRKNRRPASSRSTSCAPTSSSCRACRT